MHFTPGHYYRGCGNSGVILVRLRAGIRAAISYAISLMLSIKSLFQYRMSLSRGACFQRKMSLNG